MDTRIVAIDPKYSIGIPEMDAQHARWIHLLDEFKAVAAGELREPVRIDAAIRALEQLLDYTVSHFASEEQLLAAHRYPELDAHRKQHAELASLVGRLLDRARASDGHNTPVKLNLLATIWLLEHITQEDAKYARFILGKRSLGADPSPRATAKPAMMPITDSEESLRAFFFHVTPDALLIGDAEGIIALANRQVQTLLGYTVAELLGQSIEILVPDGFRGDHPILRVRSGAASDSPSMGQVLAVQARRKDGSQVDVEVSLGRIETGTGLFFACGLRDITERKRHAEQARQLLAENETILSHAQVGIVYLKHRRIVSCNRRLEEIFQYASGELIGESSERLYDSRATFEQVGAVAYDAVAKNPSYSTEVTLRRKDGSFFWGTLTGGAIDPEHPHEGSIWIYADVTERKLALEDLQKSEAFSLAILNSVAACVAVVDRSGTIQQVNDAWRNFGRENASEPGKTAAETGIGASYFSACGSDPNGAPHEASDARKGIQAVLDGKLRAFSLEYPCHSPTRQRWYMMNVQPFGPDARHGVVVTHTEVTEVKQLDEQHRIAATAFELQAAMMVTDAKNVILKVNQAFTEITGYTSADAVGQTPALLHSGRHTEDFYRVIWQSLDTSGTWQGEVWDRRKNGEVYPAWLTVSAVKDRNGTVTHYVAAHVDITERKTSEHKINRLAFFDPLTELPNRTLLLDRLKQVMTASGRSASYGALLFIDLDNFKDLNDALGHEVGDLLLQQVAQRLTHCVREGDTVARFGGDEFVVILANLSTNKADAGIATETVAEKILATLNQIYRFGDTAHHSSASIGATLFNGHPISIDSLMKQADLTMHKAKQAGRNRVSFFDPAMELAVKARSALESDLRRAVDAQQFLLHYQAQVAGDGRVTGAEVLVRWQHPQRGMVSPLEFIPLAEETGLILPLGHWVMATACSQLKLWAARAETAHLTLAVNVSAHQFRQPDFVDQVQAVLRDTGANPQLLKLELTESMLVENVQDIIETMLALKAMGVGFSLDDFGTGYSSLAYLKRLPLDQLKIDQSFVRDILTDPNDAAIARTIVTLAQSLGLGVIAEGVETEAQKEFLASAGCHAYQGYFFSRPVTVEAFERLVQGPAEVQVALHSYALADSSAVRYCYG